METGAAALAREETQAEAAGRPRWYRRHDRITLPGIIRFVFLYSVEILANLPAIFRLRAWYRQVKAKPASEPMVACVGDNLDEVNGIALSLRIMLRELRGQGREVFIFGTAFHTQPPRREGPDDSVEMAAGRYSLDQAGYAASEVALMRIDGFIDFLRRHPVDIIEFQTPGTVSFLCLVVAKVVGIQTLSHYRTDILTYSRLLVKNRLGIWLINTWTVIITRLMGPVIVPSEAYRAKVAEMGIAPQRIHKLPRGVDLSKFHPSKAGNGAWQRLGLPASGIKLIYVGRVSREKNLDALADIFPSLADRLPGVKLIIVGDGPYREGLGDRFRGRTDVYFTGVVQGEDLAGIFASGDALVFPSLTDTFGNSVVEALASGVPCVTSNEGGPREIIIEGESGLIFDPRIPGDLEAKILALASDPDRLSSFKAKARERALEFTYDHAAEAFWNFYRAYHNHQIP
jgi:glycosyltransferase involved in cell wall biosynthesis